MAAHPVIADQEADIVLQKRHRLGPAAAGAELAARAEALMQLLPAQGEVGRFGPFERSEIFSPLRRYGLGILAILLPQVLGVVDIVKKRILSLHRRPFLRMFGTSAATLS